MDTPVVAPTETYGEINEQISDDVLKRPRHWGWLFGFGCAFGLLSVLMASLFWLFFRGVGIWGINIPVAWGFAIVNYVWWIEIAQGGTFISAVLLLFHQPWRTSVNRMTESVTLFALACAGLFPLLHLGRPQYAFFLLPYPNTLGLWPQFISPLVWDVFAVMVYGSISIVLWYLGLLPDLATLRDRARPKYLRRFYSILSFGWRNSARHWHHYETTYKVIAALAVPLVVSVHSIVGLDFAYTIVPGWHSTIFPPAFVVGAIFAGFAMVLTLVIPIRAIYRLRKVITADHLDKMAKMLLTMGMFVLLGKLSDFFMAWYSGDLYEQYHAADEVIGNYSSAFWIATACNAIAIQLLWLKKVRGSPIALFGIAFLVNIGMWAERYLNIVGSLHRDYLPSSWGLFQATFWDWSTYVGTVGLFLTLLFLFLRFLPIVSMSEMRGLIHKENRS